MNQTVGRYTSILLTIIQVTILVVVLALMCVLVHPLVAALMAIDLLDKIWAAYKDRVNAENANK